MVKLDFSLVSRVTEKCNASCEYCYLDTKSKEMMSFEVAENLVREFQEHNTRFSHFTWIGGEPLIQSDDFFTHISEVSKKYAKPDMEITHSIQTNGLLLTPERFNFLKRIGYKLGISHDGTPELQRRRIGQKTGDQVTSAVVSKEMNAGLISVLTKESIGKEMEIYDFLKHNSTHARINLFSPTGEGLTNQERLLPTKDEASEMLVKFYNLWAGDETNFILRPHQEIIRSFFTGFSQNCEYSALSCYKILASNTKGEIYSCSRALHFPDQKLGDISEGLDSIIGSELHMRPLKRYKILKESNSDPWHQISCGGCPIEALSYSGDMMNPGYYSGEVRNKLFEIIKEDLKDAGKRAILERKAGFR